MVVIDFTRLANRLRRILLLAVCAFAVGGILRPSPSAAQIQIALPGQPCKVDPRKVDPLLKWSEPELWVWKQSCEGKMADLNERYGVKLDPKSPDGWDENRALSSTFLETILLHEPFRSTLTRNGVRIIGAWFREPVDLANAKLERELWLVKSRFESNVVLTELKSSESLLLEGSMFTGMDLRGAKIGDRLSMIGSTFTGTLDMRSMEVGGSLFMRGGEFAEPVPLIFTKIGSNLDLSGAKFASLDLSGTRIVGELGLGSEERTETEWSDSAELTLRNTVVGALQDHRDAWPEGLELEGFTYGRLGGFAGGGATDMANRDAQWFVDWLGKDKSYAPQPYQQLASVLRTDGQYDKANDVLYAGKERARSEATGLRWVGLTLLNLVVGYGYGYRYFYSLFWIVGLVALGVGVLRLTGEHKKHEIPLGIGFSLDMLLPLVELRKRHYDVDLGVPARYYFYFHTLMGYVLASFLIAGLSGLTK